MAGYGSGGLRWLAVGASLEPKLRGEEGEAAWPAHTPLEEVEARDNKQAMASPSSRVAALGLYRTLLRTAQRWPAEPTRPDRSLAAMLPDAIRSRFRASAAAESDAKKLLAYGEAELAALRRMLHSTAKKQNPATVPYSIASEAERKKARLHSDVMLSSEAQNQSQTLVAKIKRVLGY